MRAFALRTWAGTFVYYDRHSDKLRHAPAGHIAEILPVRHRNGRFEFDFATHRPGDLLAHRLSRGEFVVVSGALSEFTLRVDGFLCADTTGLIVGNRQTASAWETFTLVPMDLVQPLLGRDIDTRPIKVTSLPRSHRIPPAIHQIFINRIDGLKPDAQPPEPYRENILALKAQNPGVTHRLWRAQEIHDAIYDWFGFEILDSYLRINPRYAAARADFFRYLLIYKCGGLYLDLKSGLSKPLGEIVQPNDSYLLSYWNESILEHLVLRFEELAYKPRGEYQQWFIAAEAGHPFLESVINTVLRNIREYDKRRLGVGFQGVIRTTGPLPYTLGVDKVVDAHDHRVIESEDAGLVYRKVEAGSAFLGQHYSEMLDDIVLN